MDYQNFLNRKRIAFKPQGFSPTNLNPALFDYQKAIVERSCRLGRSAVFAGCGLGKTIIELESAQQIHNQTNGSVLILAPLAVAEQTKREGEKFGYDVRICATQSDVIRGINITNYEKLQHFDPSKFVGAIPDESSILKSFTSKTKQYIVEAFKDTPFKIAGTATPAPNDFVELGNHAEFLGVMNRNEMLATFFVHDGGDTSKWRLKKHAETEFFKWLSTFSVMFDSPADIGFPADDFTLPPLDISSHELPGELSDGYLFAVEARTLQERRHARKASLFARVQRAKELACAELSESFVVWCDFNDEGDLLEKKIPGAVQVAGYDSDSFKETAMADFAKGNIRVLVTKPSICGFGLNWQHCARQIFAGISDSYEQMYQAIRRCWRFGQDRAVNVHLIYSETEVAVLRNIERKEREAARMRRNMIEQFSQFSDFAAPTVRSANEYRTTANINLPQWLIAN